MSFLGRMVREPLVHFLLIGAAIFVVYARISSEQSAAPRDRIVITDGRLQQLTTIFTKTWQRPPTPQELHGLINTHVKEEVYYREAIKLGLDRDDTFIRRRMQQKLEFLTEPPETALVASDAELAEYLAANRSVFRVEAKLAFQQIFINSQNSDPPSAERIENLKASASNARSDSDVRGLGDPTLLPHAMPLVAISQIDRIFGPGFGRRLTELPINKWQGPIRSSYGLHIVRVSERRDSYDPSLDEIRVAVERKWRAVKRESYQQAAYQRLREKYEVVLPNVRDGKQEPKWTP